MLQNTDVVLRTQRLTLHLISVADAAFIHRLLNEAAFLQFIGDKGVRNLVDAEQYIRDVPLASYAAHDYGGYLVRLRDDHTAIGMCGLYQRDDLSCPDLGFAFCEAFWGGGYATEASRGVLSYSRNELRLAEIAAIVDPGNTRSIRLIEKLGFLSDGAYRVQDAVEELRLFRLTF